MYVVVELYSGGNHSVFRGTMVECEDYLKENGDENESFHDLYLEN